MVGTSATAAKRWRPLTASGLMRPVLCIASPLDRVPKAISTWPLATAVMTSGRVLN